MRVTGVETFRVDAGWRTHGFVKVSGERGLAGWSECSQAHDGPGLMRTIAELSPLLAGRDPSSPAVDAALAEARRVSRLAHQAVGALQNALLDLHARSLGMPVHRMLGGVLRNRVRAYWSHCGTYRVQHHAAMGEPPLRTRDDLVALGRQVATRGYTALKTNMLLLDEGRARRFGREPGDAAIAVADPGRLVRAMREQLGALREGAGPDVELMVDVGNALPVETCIALAREMESFGVTWLEVEDDDPAVLRRIRAGAAVPIATGERFTRDGYRPFLEDGTAEIVITDVLVNGLPEALAIASLAEGFGRPIAPHNCYGPLATLIATAFCAMAPAFRVMETDVDQVPWTNDLVSEPPRLENGHVLLPSGPGWGTEVNEDLLRAHARL